MIFFVVDVEDGGVFFSCIFFSLLFFICDGCEWKHKGKPDAFVPLSEEAAVLLAASAQGQAM